MAVQLGRYKPDYRGIEKIATGREIQQAVLDIAERAKSVATALSAEARDTGDYINSFRVHGVIQRDTLGRNPKNRAVAFLVNDSDAALQVEYGRNPSGSNAGFIGYRIFGRTKDQITSTT